MNYSQKMVFHEALVVLAFAYVMRQQTAAAVYFAVLGAFLAVWAHSWKCLWRKSGEIVLASLVEILLVKMVDMDLSAYGLGIVMVMNAVVTGVWSSSSRKAIVPALTFLLRGYGALLVIAFVLPQQILEAGAGRLGSVVLLVAMGLPALVVRMRCGYRKKVMMPL